MPKIIQQYVRQLIIQRYINGDSAIDISKDYGINKSSVYNIILNVIKQSE